MLLKTVVEIQEDKLHCTSTLQAFASIRFAAIPLAKAGHMAEPSLEPGNKYYSQEVEGNEYLQRYSPYYHWVQSLTLYSEKLPSLGLFGGRINGAFTFKNNFTDLFFLLPSYSNTLLHTFLCSLDIFSHLLSFT